MVDIMNDNEGNAPPVFAIGLAHWLYGETSFENLLREQGYTVERVDGAYDADLLPDATMCGVSSPGIDDSEGNEEEPTAIDESEGNAVSLLGLLVATAGFSIVLL